MKIVKFFSIFLLLNIILFLPAHAESFNDWVIKFKNEALKSGISKKTVNDVMNKAIFLPKVIEYDRYQPEFYEDTATYINKRVNESKISIGKQLFICLLYTSPSPRDRG